MNNRSRLHLYTHKGPCENAYIVGEKSALLQLSQALKQAATGVLGLERVSLYTSDGHNYNIIITSNVEEHEWQNIDPCYQKNSSPEHLESVKTYLDLTKQTL